MQSLNLDHSNNISKLMEYAKLGLFNMQKVSKETYIFLGHTLCWNLYHFSKNPLGSCLHPGISLIDGNIILIELPCVCLAQYFVKAVLILLFSPADTLQRISQVYTELLTRIIRQKEIEQLAIVINVPVFGVIFP